MNPVNVIRGNKFIHEMLPAAMICQSKASKVLMLSDMPLGLRSSAKKGTVIRSIQADNFKDTTVRHQSTKFVPLCRIIGRMALKFSVIYIITDSLR